MTYAFWSAWLANGLLAIFGILLAKSLIPKQRKDTLEDLLSRTPPFAFRSVERSSSEREISPACTHPEAVKVDDLLGNHVTNWCPDCEVTLYT